MNVGETILDKLNQEWLVAQVWNYEGFSDLSLINKKTGERGTKRINS